MKTEINEKGELIINPDTAVEAYALRKWYEGYFYGGFETLIINVDVNEKPKRDEKK